MARRRRYDAGRQAAWVDRVRRQRESGRSVRAFCAAEQVKESAFYHWRRELLARGVIPGREVDTGSVRACGQAGGREAGGGGWAEVRVSDAPAEAEAPAGSPVDEDADRVEMRIGGSLAVRATVRDAALLIRALLAHGQQAQHPAAPAGRSC